MCLAHFDQASYWLNRGLDDKDVFNLAHLRYDPVLAPRSPRSSNGRTLRSIVGYTMASHLDDVVEDIPIG
jgi:hypothetical protein